MKLDAELKAGATMFRKWAGHCEAYARLTTNDVVMADEISKLAGEVDQGASWITSAYRRLVAEGHRPMVAVLETAQREFYEVMDALDQAAKGAVPRSAGDTMWARFQGRKFKMAADNLKRISTVFLGLVQQLRQEGGKSLKGSGGLKYVKAQKGGTLTVYAGNMDSFNNQLLGAAEAIRRTGRPLERTQLKGLVKACNNWAATFQGLVNQAPQPTMDYLVLSQLLSAAAAAIRDAMKAGVRYDNITADDAPDRGEVRYIRGVLNQQANYIEQAAVYARRAAKALRRGVELQQQTFRRGGPRRGDPDDREF